MSSSFHKLPLRALTVFEAAARHGRFTAAADELLMTQAAVSQHVAMLEADLGVDLFVRRRRGVELTSAGAAVLDPVQLGLKILADGVASVRRGAGGKTIQLLTDYGFAGWWLMHRLGALADLLPGVEICVATTQADLDQTDAPFDLSIMFGHGDWSGFNSTSLFPEEVYPVCTPGYLSAAGILQDTAPTDASSARLPITGAQVAQLRLLHLGGGESGRWFTWQDWFTANGISPGDSRQGPVFENAQLLLQATLLGQGVSLGWRPLIDDLVAGGALLRLTETPLRSRRGYFVVEHINRPYAANIATLKAWLLDPRHGQSADNLMSTERSQT
jgi:DNA-binding transcriptional LysR family regulator